VDLSRQKIKDSPEWNPKPPSIASTKHVSMTTTVGQRIGRRVDSRKARDRNCGRPEPAPMFAWLRRRRRVAIRRRPFPTEWRAIIERNVPYVACLPSEDREELARHIQVFLAEKHFEGCGGLVITDEARVTIAALLVTKGFHWIQGCRASGWNDTRHDTDGGGETECGEYDPR
jgi:hypothetical protein